MFIIIISQSLSISQLSVRRRKEFQNTNCVILLYYCANCNLIVFVSSWWTTRLGRAKMSCFLKCAADTSVTIPNHIANNGITYYLLQVCVGPTISWTVQRRYKEFVDLNDKLISGHSISKDLLPPKKVKHFKSSFLQSFNTIISFVR